MQIDSNNILNATIFIKEIIRPIVNYVIKEYNRSVSGNGIKLIVSGGDAIQSYFGN